MGQLFDLKRRVEQEIKKRGADEFQTKGQIGMRSGVLIGLLTENTPDDAEKIRKFKAAIKDVLNLDV